MNIINVLKYPVTDVGNCIDIYKDIKADRISFEKKEFNASTLEKRKRANQIKLATHAAPLASAGMLMLAFGCIELYEAYEAGQPFLEAMGGTLESAWDKMSKLADESFTGSPLADNKDFLTELAQRPFEVVSGYAKYIASGVMNFVSGLAEKSINTALLVSTMGIYAATRAGIKAMSIVSGEAEDLSKARFYESEDLKMKILRKHHHDPVFDNLNDEELFAMSYSFNEVLSRNNKGKKKVMRFMLEKIELFDFIVKPFRKAFNSSNNDSPKLMTQVFKFLEDDIALAPEDSFKKYGVSKVEFNTVASSKYGHLNLPKEVQKKEYIFNVNKRAIMAAYKRKLRDDMLLAYSLKLETLAKGNVSATDKDVLEKFSGFVQFIELYEHGDKIFEGSKLDPALKSMKKQAIGVLNQDPNILRSIANTEVNKSYIDFLAENTSHLVEKKEDGQVYLNNYSFISYFEAERERYARKDALEERMKESLVAMAEKSNVNNNLDYKIHAKKLEEIQEELISLSSVFFKEESIIGRKKKDVYASVMKTGKGKISSIYKDHEAGYEVSVRNFLSDKEKESLIRGEALKEKGVTESTARRIAVLREDIDSKTKDYSPSISRRSFKDRSKKFRN